MRLKTFKARSTGEAMNLVKREFGEEALILSTVEENGWFMITAALERAPQIKPPQMPAHNNVLQDFCKLLELHHIPESISEKFIERASACESQSLRGLFENIITFDELWNRQKAIAPPKVLVLVGPSGAGKSVTTAKLASEYLVNGYNPFVITTDTLKAGAVAQLEFYTRAMGISLHTIDTVPQLKGMLSTAPTNAQVIIDTPGVNSCDVAEMGVLSKILAEVGGRAVFVLPAGIDPHELNDQLTVYAKMGIKDLIHTRVDTTRRLGALMTALGAGHFNFLMVSAGPELGSRLRPASAALLEELLVTPLARLAANSHISSHSHFANREAS